MEIENGNHLSSVDQTNEFSVNFFTEANSVKKKLLLLYSTLRHSIAIIPELIIVPCITQTLEYSSTMQHTNCIASDSCIF